jgi:hypothetical protein
MAITEPFQTAKRHYIITREALVTYRRKGRCMAILFDDMIKATVTNAIIFTIW